MRLADPWLVTVSRWQIRVKIRRRFDPCPEKLVEQWHNLLRMGVWGTRGGADFKSKGQ